MADPFPTHFRIADEACQNFVTADQHETKEAAEDAASVLIERTGGPSMLCIYALAAKVCVATESTDVDS